MVYVDGKRLITTADQSLVDQNPDVYYYDPEIMDTFNYYSDQESKFEHNDFDIEPYIDLVLITTIPR